MGIQKCIKCEKFKSFEDFWKRRKRSGELVIRGECKDCSRVLQRRYGSKQNKNARIKRPEQYKAKYLVRAAVFNGRLKKPRICSECNKIFAINKIQAHHENYSKPYDVIWLCFKCHRALHDARKLCLKAMNDR